MPTAPISPADLELLGKSPLFRAMPPEALRTVADAGRRVQFETGDAFFHEGQKAENAYFLLHGGAKLVQASPEGQAVVVRVIAPGEVMGLVSVLEGSNYPATALAMEHVDAVRWPGAPLHRLLEAHPQIALNLLPVLVGRIHELQAQFRELATERVERRVARVLLRLVRQSGEKVDGVVRITMRLTRQDLAEMTGTTLFTVSRILSRWEEEGVVGTVRKHVLIKNPHQLVSIAEDLPALGPGLRDSKER